jgi:uncharacterized repeat protein (TIGR01451 family)
MVDLGSAADNTLYQVPSIDVQQLSNGAGQHFFVGKTSPPGTNKVLRGAIKFDLTSVPAGSTVTSATLKLHLSKTSSGPQGIALHRATMDWGEGTSQAAGEEGAGANATDRDVTWFYTFFNTGTWNTPGGDFVATGSATTSVDQVGMYQWTGAGLTADVQQWVNNRGTNFGWILTGNEAAGPSSKRFDTKENMVPGNRPVLTVEYTTAGAATWAITKTHSGNFRQGDAADTYTVNVRNSGSGPTAGTATVTDTLPAGLAPTPADNGVINGWTVSSSGQTITATRNDVLAPGNSYPALTLTVSVANNAPASVTNMATVSGGGAANPASANDPTTIVQAANLTITKSHSGNFRQGDPADTYALTVTNMGQGPTVGTVTVTDTLPAGLAPTSADSGVINGWTVSSSGQTITATRSDVLASSGSYPVLTLTVGVSATAPASVTNTATVAGGGQIETGNHSASDPTTIIQSPILSIAKSHTGTFNPGDPADVYTIRVGNVGAAPTDGSAVTVTDPLPAGLSPTPADNDTINGWTVSFSGQTVSATRTDVLAGGGNYPALPITVSVAEDVARVVTNTATVAGGGALNPASASDPTATTPVAELTISKSHTGNFRQGDPAAVYTLTVSNIGPGATVGTVTITDMLPTGLAPAAADSGVINGWTVAVNGQNITATRDDVLASGSSYPVLTLTVGVSATAPAMVTNTATVDGGGQVNAPHSASDPTTILQVADLTISKSHMGNFHRGDNADVYTITVSNIGAAPTDGSTVTVTDTLPAGLAPTAADNGIINGWTVSFNGQTITATRRDILASNAAYPALTITVRVANNAPATVTNTATVAGGGEINTANDTANDVTTITQAVGLTITVSHGGSFNSGSTATYTVTVGNSGGTATSAPVTVTAILATGLTYTGPASVNGWTITVNSQTVVATRQDALAGGASFPALTLNVSVATNATGGYLFTATVSGGGTGNISGGFDVAGGQTPRRRGADTPPGSPPSTSAVLNRVANSFTHGDEYFANLVTQDYLQLLHRTPSTGEVNSWVGQLKGGLSDEQVLAGFTSSMEYYQQAGSTDASWIDALYHDMLGRSPDAAGKASWLVALASGSSRLRVALAIATSVERESSVIVADYQRYLGRGASAAEIAVWLSNLQHGMSSEQVAAAFVASDEFYNNRASSLGLWLDGAYQAALQRDPDLNGFNSWYRDMRTQLTGL